MTGWPSKSRKSLDRMQEASISSWANEGHVQAVFRAKSSSSFQIEVDVDKLDQG